MNEINTRGSKVINYTVVLFDLVIFILMFLLCIYTSPFSIPGYIDKNLDNTISLALVAGVCAEFIYNPIITRRRVSVMDIVQRVFKLSLLQTVIFMFAERFYAGESDGILRFCCIYVIYNFVTICTLRFIERMLLNYVRRLGHNTNSVVFVGSDPANLFVYRNMINDANTGYRVIGYYSDDILEDAPDELTHLGTKTELIESINRGESPVEANEMYVSLSHSNEKDLETIMRYCDSKVIKFFYVPRILGNISLNLSPIHYGEITLFTNHINPLARLDNKIIKRLFDIFVSAIACLLILPFIPIIWIIIKVQSPGPMLFGQKRTGLNGKTFTCWKFRSMHINANADTIQATKNDPRKFPFGEFMRKTNIDEFPQFFNVLIGDMSIVGPRPHMLFHTDHYSELIDKYMVRHFSKPGITGWAQVTGFRGETKELWQMEERIKHDIWYYENWSFWLDIEIILRTALSIIHPDKNAY